MKKLLSLALVLMLALSVTALADYEGGAPVFDEPVTISVLGTNSASLTQDFANMGWYQALLEKANVKLELELVDPTAYSDVVQPRIAAGQDLPDIVRVPNTVSAAESELFVPLNDMIDKYGFNLNKFFDKYPTIKPSEVYIDGNIYFIPYIFTTESNYRTLLFNHEWVESFGMTLDDIQTVDDLYNYLVKVKETDLNGNGDTTDEIPLYCRDAGMAKCLAMYWGNKADVLNGGGFGVDEDGKVFCAYTTDEFRQYLEFFSKLYAEGLVNQDYNSASWDLQCSAEAEHKSAVVMDFISNGITAARQYNPAFTYDDVPAYWIKGLKGTDGNLIVYGRGLKGAEWGITTFCENPEDAFKFMDYMYSEEAGIMVWYGLEGKDYNLVDGEFEFTDVYMDNVDNYRTIMGYNFDGLPGYQYDYASVAPQLLKEQTAQYADYPINPSFVKKFYTEDQQEVLNTYLTDLNTYFNENSTAFMIGTRSLDEWDDYVAGAEAMGVNEVLAVYQEVEDNN